MSFFKSKIVIYLIQVSLLAIAYALGAKLAVSIPGINRLAAALWPPAGISQAALILMGKHLWPGIVVGAFLFDIIQQKFSILSALASGLGASLQAMVAVSWLILLTGISWIVFASKTEAAIALYPLEYLPFPLIIWAALQFGQKASILASFLVSSIAIWGGSQGGGPFVTKAENISQAILLLQTFMGVITIKKFIYDLWGDTVNIASRMESQGQEGCIQVTETTYQLLKEHYNFEFRGEIFVKGKGEMITYFLVGRITN